MYNQSINLVNDVNREWHIIPVSAQQQDNDVDCGIFSLAYATSLLFGENPTNISYDITRMRQHLDRCLAHGKVQPFPKILDGACEIKATSSKSSIQLESLHPIPRIMTRQATRSMSATVVTSSPHKGAFSFTTPRDAARCDATRCDVNLLYTPIE